MSGDELVDLVDEADRVIGQAPRRVVRRDNLRHRCVYVLVFDESGQLLIHQRTATKDVFPGWWDVTVGGIPRAGEAYDAAARRELAEEVGVTGVPLRRGGTLRYADRQNRVCGTVYACTVTQIGVVQESEIAAVAWIRPAAVAERAAVVPFCPDGIEALRCWLAECVAGQRL